MRILRVRSLIILGVFCIVGCFAIELDVDKDGKLLVTREEGFFLVDPVQKEVKLIQKAVPGTEPVYSRFSPNGKQILTVAKEGYQTFQLSLVEIETGKSSKLLKVDQAANARFSPDGKYLAVVAGSKEDDPEFKSKVPELHLVTLADGKSKRVAKKIGVQIRWLPDSKQILLVDVKSKIDDSNFLGNVSLLDVATSKLTPKIAIIGPQDFAFDTTPDGNTAVITAAKTGKVGVKMTLGESYDYSLFQLNLKSGDAKNLEIKPKYAFYSPNGKSLLLGLDASGFNMTSASLEVANASDVSERTVIGEVAFPLAFGGEGKVLAGWINDEKIYYFVERKVYGTTGKSMQLITAKADGSERQLLQPMIDTAAWE